MSGTLRLALAGRKCPVSIPQPDRGRRADFERRQTDAGALPGDLVGIGDLPQGAAGRKSAWHAGSPKTTEELGCCAATP